MFETPAVGDMNTRRRNMRAARSGTVLVAITPEAARAMQSRTFVVSIVGAAVGGAVAYLLFSEHGRELRRRLEPAFDDVTRELGHFRTTIQKAAGVVDEGLKLLNE